MIAVRPLASAAIFAIALSGAAAQSPFGSLFDPPRPPGNVGPPGAQSQPSPPPAEPRLLPPGPPPASPYGRIQSEDLPAPGLPRTGTAPPAPPPGQRPQRAGAPPAPGTPAPGAPGATPASVAAAPPEDAVTPPPPQRVANPIAVFAGLDKITGRITAFDTAIGETVQFGALQVTARACYSRPPTEAPYTDGFVEVDEVTLQGEVKRIFTGWMFSASPGLHAVEHAINDVRLTDCKGGLPVADAQPAAPPPAAAPPARAPARGQAPQRQPAPRQTLAPPGATLTQPGAPR